jgi:malyl-CoA/(S)-citramalyl-CoA lyase
MQGLSLGPADLAADRRMKTTRVGGGHPGYLVRQDPPESGDIDAAGRATAQQDLWHYTVARMVDACAMAGILPFYGPFGDIQDTVACEDQFRNAYLLGCVGAWSLHPVQIDIAKRVFSPEPTEVAWAKRVVEEMGDGAGAVMIDGKMQDDATYKQCLVVLELARSWPNGIRNSPRPTVSTDCDHRRPHRTHPAGRSCHDHAGRRPTNAAACEPTSAAKAPACPPMR